MYRITDDVVKETYEYGKVLGKGASGTVQEVRHSLTHSLTHSLIHSPSHSLLHSLSHSLFHSLSHLLFHSLTANTL
jgi:hypothetical protein